MAEAQREVAGGDGQQKLAAEAAWRLILARAPGLG